MSERIRLPLPSLNPIHARDIGRGHMALAEQYRFGGQDDVADEHERLAELWLAYARTLLMAPGPTEAT